MKRIMKIMGPLLILALWALLATPVLAADNGGDEGNITAKALALLFAGLIAPYLTQWLKKVFGDVEALPALWIAFGVSVALSAICLLVTGELGWTAPPSEPIAAVTWFFEFAGTVFALATLVYKVLIKRPEPEPPPE